MEHLTSYLYLPQNSIQPFFHAVLLSCSQIGANSKVKYGRAVFIVPRPWKISETCLILNAISASLKRHPYYQQPNQLTRRSPCPFINMINFRQSVTIKKSTRVGTVTTAWTLWGTYWRTAMSITGELSMDACEIGIFVTSWGWNRSMTRMICMWKAQKVRKTGWTRRLHCSTIVRKLPYGPGLRLWRKEKRMRISSWFSTPRLGRPKAEVLE